MQVDSVQGHDLNVTIDRLVFEELAEATLAQIEGPVVKALEDASMGVDEITHVVLVGGATRMPKIREWVEEYFG